MSEEALRQPLATAAESDVVRRTDCMAAWREEAHPGPYSQSRLGLGPSMLLRSLSLLDLQAGRAALHTAVLQARLAGGCLGSWGCCCQSHCWTCRLEVRYKESAWLDG